MFEGLPTFSESWYRIAGQRICLRPGVKTRRQNFRGERWIVLENPFSNQYFRVRPAAYEFVARLIPQRTVQQAWQDCLDRFPDEAPGQEAVIQLLSQLYQANLLQYDQAADSTQLFERYRKRRQREISARLLNLMFIRIPLIDPDAFLIRTLPVVGRVINAFGAALWLGVVGWALKIVADNFTVLFKQGQGVLAPENLFLLYAGLVIVKTFHEFGHAYFCRKFGGEVHAMGIQFMIFAPVPYMDATSAWGFRSRWKRVLVGSAGMIVELFIAAIATFIWAATAPGTLHSLAYNIMFVASASTIIVNANPLLRFDGYYILSDLVEIPNLAQRANQQLGFLWEHYVFGVKQAESPTQSRREATWLVVYGIASGIYRVIVFGGVLLLVADRFLLIGMLMAAICAISWIAVPTGKFLRYLATSSRLARVRPRAVAVTVALAAVLLLLLGIIPFPHHYRAPGVLKAKERTIVVADVAGRMSRLLAKPGTVVAAGQPLIELQNRELELSMDDARARLVETEARLRQALSRTNADLKPLQSRLKSTEDRLQKLAADQKSLIVRARHTGVWVAPGVDQFVGRLIEHGTPLGLIVNPEAFEFVAIVDQTDADAAFAHKPSGAEVRLNGQAGTVLRADHWRVVPGGNQTLPSAALGWAAGGEVAISKQEPTKAATPFFEVQADVTGMQEVAQLHGRSGKIRFDLEPEPLLQRWLRRLWQLLQTRYQL